MYMNSFNNNAFMAFSALSLINIRIARLTYTLIYYACVARTREIQKIFSQKNFPLLYVSLPNNEPLKTYTTE